LNLIEQLFPRARAEVIRLLFTDPERSLHLRELARLSGLAVGTIQSEVSKLREAGLLEERRDGNRLYLSANTGNPIFTELRGIAVKTTGLRMQLVEALDGLEGIRLALVYGSFAAGGPGPKSDIDLLIIGSVGLRKLAPRTRGVSETMGREVNPHVLSEGSFTAKWRARDAFINSVINAPKLWIIGNDDELGKLA